MEQRELQNLLAMRQGFSEAVAAPYLNPFDNACRYAIGEVQRRVREDFIGVRKLHYAPTGSKYPTNMTTTTQSASRATMTDAEKRLLKQMRKWMRNPYHSENLRVLTALMVDHEIKRRLDALEARNASAVESSA